MSGDIRSSCKVHGTYTAPEGHGCPECEIARLTAYAVTSSEALEDTKDWLTDLRACFVTDPPPDREWVLGFIDQRRAAINAALAKNPNPSGNEAEASPETRESRVEPEGVGCVPNPNHSAIHCAHRNAPCEFGCSHKSACAAERIDSTPAINPDRADPHADAMFTPI